MLAELETQFLISKNLNFISEEQYQDFDTKFIEIAKMLNSLITSIQKSNP